MKEHWYKVCWLILGVVFIYVLAVKMNEYRDAQLLISCTHEWDAGIAGKYSPYFQNPALCLVQMKNTLSDNSYSHNMPPN